MARDVVDLDADVFAFDPVPDRVEDDRDFEDPDFGACCFVATCVHQPFLRRPGGPFS